MKFSSIRISNVAGLDFFMPYSLFQPAGSFQTKIYQSGCNQLGPILVFPMKQFNALTLLRFPECGKIAPMITEYHNSQHAELQTNKMWCSNLDLVPYRFGYVGYYSFTDLADL